VSLSQVLPKRPCDLGARGAPGTVLTDGMPGSARRFPEKRGRTRVKGGMLGGWRYRHSGTECLYASADVDCQWLAGAQESTNTLLTQLLTENSALTSIHAAREGSLHSLPRMPHAYRRHRDMDTYSACASCYSLGLSTLGRSCSSKYQDM